MNREEIASMVDEIQYLLNRIDESEEDTEEQEETTVVSLDTMTLVDKVDSICHMVCDNILTENVLIENGTELLAIVKSAAINEQLKEQ